MPNYITLPRSQLYEMVWTKPVRDVAADFGISDVALAKRCRAINIPLPPRGYWARVAAGQTSKRGTFDEPPEAGPTGEVQDGPSNTSRTPLPALHAKSRAAKPALGAPKVRERPQAASPDPDRTPSYVQTHDASGPLAEPAITFDPVPPPNPAEPAAPPSPEDAALRARIDALDITSAATLTAAHPAVLRTAERLMRPWRKDIAWARGTRHGPILEFANVSEAQLDRALLTLNDVLRAADSLDWRFRATPKAETQQRRYDSWEHRPPEPPDFGRLVVEGEPMAIRIDERRRQFDHVPTEGEKADIRRGRNPWMPRFDFEPSGELRLHVASTEWGYTQKTWKDTRTRPLETQVRTILHGLLGLALQRKQQRDEQRLREIADRERVRQREIAHRRREANEQLIHTLEAQAGAWHRARYLRRYLRAAGRALGSSTVTVDLLGCSTDFIDWAEHYVNQLEPLHPEPRDPDVHHEHDVHYGVEEKRLQEELARLFGQQWQHTSKLVAELTNGTDQPDADG